MTSETACVVEKWIDEYIESLQSNDIAVRKSVKSLILLNGVKSREAKWIANHFNELLTEIDNVLDKVDADLMEGWSYLNTTKLRRLRSYLETIVNDFAIKGTVTRRKRKINPERLVKSLKYLDMVEGIGESADPENIIGAKRVLLYNIKQKKISLYLSETGLTVKGSTLKNFDSSIVKSCGRKNNQWIKSLVSYPPGRMIKELTNLRSKEQDSTGRINKDTLILRVYK